MARMIVTITPPTPNGDLHIGHLAGPFLSADVFTRIQRQQGHECILVSYSDDYQSYLIRKGLETFQSVTDLAEQNTDRIEATLEATGIAVDHWMRPRLNPYYHRAAADIHAAAVKVGAISRKISSEPYCPTCHTWGYEAFGRGNCNYCGTDSDASQCEKCAFPPIAAKMTEFHCKLCLGPFEWRSVEREFLDMARYEPYLRELFARQSIRAPLCDWPEIILRDGPAEWAITRPDEAGLDLHGDASRRLHTWFLGLAGYMGAVREYADLTPAQPGLYEQFWERGDTRLVHFLGHDCAYSHMVVYPSLLSNFGNSVPRPQFYPNQFLKLDGKNLSTSRNHAIWGKDLVRSYHRDGVRLYLASIAPETAESDFRIETFKSWYKTEFDGTLRRLIKAARAERSDGPIPENATDDVLLLQTAQAQWRVAASPDTFSMRALARVVLDLIAAGNDRLTNERPVSRIVDMIGHCGTALLPTISKDCMVVDAQVQLAELEWCT